jgi:hypothetical protein
METEFYCPKCKWWISEEGLKDEDSRVIVSVFGLHCPRDHADLESRAAEFTNYARRACDKERRSLAMGIRPEDIPVAMKKWPGSRYDKDGALLISGRAEKKLRMKQRGFCEY